MVEIKKYSSVWTRNFLDLFLHTSVPKPQSATFQNSIKK